MNYTVLLFAGLRQRVQRPSVDVELPPTATVSDLLAELGRRYPALAGSLSQCRVAIDQEFAGPRAALGAARELAVIPPVSGGSDDRYRLSDDPLSLDAVVRAVTHDGAGGITTFTGNVRSRSRGQTIVRLEYEAYRPMALRVIRSIGAAIEAEVKGSRLAIHHRLGTLEVGETAVVIAASAAHREQAFAACREAIERLKRDAPIWKKEISADGSAWIGTGP